MQRILLGVGLLLLLAGNAHAQSQGITYQAIIIDPKAKEIPGVDVTGSFASDQPLTVRFTIYDSNGIADYQETHNTRTDIYGMINLIIGQGTPTGSSPSGFSEIDWDGTPKDLLVEISLGSAGNEFTEFSLQKLTFVPYAFHRNVYATGDLIVGGRSTFNGEVEFQDITVNGISNMNGPFNVNNGSPSNLSGPLNVTNGSPSVLSGDLTVLGSGLFQIVTVEGATTLNNSLTVNAPSALNGQVIIDVGLPNNKFSKDSYPLLVQGSAQGIAVTITGSRSSANNFVSFWDVNGMQGRIEGQTSSEVTSSFEYIWTNTFMALDIGFLVAEAACTAAQLDACEAVLLAAQAIAKGVEIGEYNISAINRAGVAYESTSGDYAEWLERLNPDEKLTYGDIVGVRGGKISIGEPDPDHFMIISKSPIVLGNMPSSGMESRYEKVAFIGQVPAKVRGPVEIGDYILASSLNDGIGIGKNPKMMEIDDYQRIVGVAWSDVMNPVGVNMVNVAVGLHTYDMMDRLNAQQAEINAVKHQLNTVMEYIQSKDPTFQPSLFEVPQKRVSEIAKQDAKENQPESGLTNVYWALEELQRDPTYLIEAQRIARDILKERGIDYNRFEQTKRLVTDESYLIQTLRETLGLVTPKK